MDAQTIRLHGLPPLVRVRMCWYPSPSRVIPITTSSSSSAFTCALGGLAEYGDELIEHLRRTRDNGAAMEQAVL